MPSVPSRARTLWGLRKPEAERQKGFGMLSKLRPGHTGHGRHGALWETHVIQDQMVLECSSDTELNLLFVSNQNQLSRSDSP